MSTTVDGSDAVPGDGICEKTAGAHDCSLRAAIDEANARSDWLATIELPPNTHTLNHQPVDDDANARGDLDVAPASRHLTIQSSAPGAVIDAGTNGGGLDLRSGTIDLRRIEVRGATGFGFRAGAGTVVSITQGASIGNGGVGVDVSASSTAHLTNTTMSGNGGGGVRNLGRAVFSYTTITDNGAGGITGAGTNEAEASVIGAQRSGSNCPAAITSRGYNLSSDFSCQLAAVGDQWAPPLLGPLSTDAGVRYHHPLIGSPLLDAVPVASGVCAANSRPAVDQRDKARPIAIGCDRGSVEADFVLDLVVNDGGDAHDAAVSDGVCATASGACTLRAAVDQTNARPITSGHNIELTVDPTLSLSPSNEDSNAGGDLDIRARVSIQGNGHTITASAGDRAVHNVSNVLSLDDVVIRGGQSNAAGGGVLNSGGTLAITDSTLTANTAASHGGGLAVSAGSVTVARSTIADNDANGYGGGLDLSGGSMTLSNSTISANQAASGAAMSVSGSGSIAVTASTVAGNEGMSSVLATATSVSVSGSILATTTGSLCNAPVGSNGWNIATDRTCGLAQASDRQAVNPLLGPLASNGGPTATMLPASNSPAVDAIPVGTSGICDASASADQRGVTRPQAGSCDIGSTEGTGPAILPLSLTVDTATDGRDASPGDGVCAATTGGCTLRSAVDETNARPSVDVITIAPGINPVLQLAGTDDTNAAGDIDVLGFVTIRAGGATVDANSIDRVIHLHHGQLVLDDVTLTRGRAGSGGGVQTQGGDLEIDNSTISSNFAYQAGGGVAVAAGSFTVNASVIEQNTGTDGAGLSGAGVSGATITRSAIRNNQLAWAGSGGGLHLSNVANAKVDQTTIAGNGSTAIIGRHGGGVYLSGAKVTIERSTIRDNVLRDDMSKGGGIYATASTATLHSSTVAGNVAAHAAGLHMDYGTYLLNHATVADNDGWSTLAAPQNSGFASPVVTGSVITPRGGVSCEGTLSSGGWNVIDDGTCGLATPTDQPGTNPLLPVIGANGGPTDTIVPFGNSPTRDRIPVGTAGLCDAAAGNDQRGLPRPAGGACDVGAVEGDNGLTATPRSLQVTDAADSRDAVPGDGICNTGTGTCTIRAAIDEANHYPTADTITIGVGVNPVLSRPDDNEPYVVGDEANASGDLDSWSALVVEGAGSTIDGGGLDGVIHQRARSLSLRHIAITGGARPNGSRGYGGGVGVSQGSLALDHADVHGNVALPYHIGGGVSGADAAIVVTDSHIHDNRSHTGAGIGGSWSNGTSVRIERSRVDGNTATDKGGGVGVVSGDLTVIESTIDDNQATYGGGISAIDGTLERSTVSRNRSYSGAGVLTTGQFDIHASTVSGNDAGSAQTAGPGGAITGGLLDISSSTIADNRGSSAIQGTTATLSGTILDSRTGSACGPGTQATSAGWNIVVDSTCFTGTPTDHVSATARLLPLADNGGPTQTHLAPSTSPAIDAIPPGTAGLCDAGATVDQRNVTKPANGKCDIGSVEGAGAATTPLSMIVDTSVDGRDADPGDGLCGTASGACTMRAAVDEANASPTDDTITIATGVNPMLTLAGISDDSNATGDLDVFGGIVLHGNDRTLDGGQLDRVLDLRAGSVRIDRLTIRGGRLTDNYTEAAGIRVSAGDLLLEQVQLIENRVDTYQSNGGGLLVRNANVTVVDSLIADNTAYSGSGVWAESGTVQIRRSTLAGNTNNVVYNEATMTLDNVTVTENLGVVIRQDGGTLDLTRSTLVRNVAYWTLERNNGVMRVSGSAIDGGGGQACWVGLPTGEYNAVSDYSCFSSATNRRGIDSLVGPLADNGGPTPTVVPLTGSPLLDLIPAGTTGLCDSGITDQRGVARPAGAACDAGSVEGVGPPPSPLHLTVNSPLDAPDATLGDGTCASATGVCTLRAAIGETNHNAGPDTITIGTGIEPTLSILGPDEDLNLTGDLDHWGDLVIEGGGSTIHGNQVDRVLHHRRGRLELRHLTIEGGRMTSSGAGAGIFTTGDLDLEYVTIRDNRLTGTNAAGAGLAAGWSGPTLRTTTVRSSAIIRNNSGGNGGGIAQSTGSTVVLTNSTVSSNTAPNGSAISSSGGVQLVGSTVWANNGASLIMGSVTTRGSILAFAVGATCTAPATSGGWNLTVDSSCGLTQASDRQNTPHGLSSLANNGGETLTHRPAAGSAAVNAIPVGTVGLCDGSIPVDQRGNARPAGAACDRGSVEQ